MIAALALPVAKGMPQVIIPGGTFEAPLGAMGGEGPWTLTEGDAEKLIKKLVEVGRDVVIDYEHQTLLSAQNGQPAPAAGWISFDNFIWDQGLVAKEVVWTETAAKMIAGGEYRFLSPVFEYKEGVPITLLSVGLTNTPALPNLPEVRLAAAKSIIRRKTEMLEELIKILGLAPDAAEQDVVETIKALMAAIQDQSANKAEAATLRSTVAALTAQNEELKTSDEGKLAALEAENKKLESHVAELKQNIPVNIFQELKNEVAALRAAQLTSEKEALIEEGLKDAKLLPSMKEWAETVDIATLKSFLDTATPIAALTGLQTSGMQPKQQLSDVEARICKSLGLTSEQFIGV